MYKDIKVCVVICAGGTGNRMGSDIPKQFMTLDVGGTSMTMLEASIRKFTTGDIGDMVNYLIVTSPFDYMKKAKSITSNVTEDPIIDFSVLAGGAERQDSVRGAVDYLHELGFIDDDIVLIHDAARPFVSHDTIKGVLKAAYEKKAAIAAVPVTDTIRDVDSGTLDRAKLYSVQTPQGFRLGVIREALKKADSDGFQGTDDGGIVERIGIMPEVVPGSYGNIKITTKEDLGGVHG